MKLLRKLKKPNLRQFINERPPAEIVELQYLLAERIRSLDKAMKEAGFHPTDFEMPAGYDEKTQEMREILKLDDQRKAALKKFVYGLSLKKFVKVQEYLIEIEELTHEAIEQEGGKS